MGNASAPIWWWPDDKMLTRQVVGLPQLEAALQLDPAGLRTFLDVALLTLADDCIFASHLGNVVNILRDELGKSACHPLHPRATRGALRPSSPQAQRGPGRRTASLAAPSTRVGKKAT